MRLYTWRDAVLDDSFFAARVREAVALRRSLPCPKDAVRLVFSESDRLSGLTVDRYGNHLSVQLTSLALARRREGLLDALEDEIRPEGIVLRTEKGVLEDEGLELADGVLRGSLPEDPVIVREHGLKFLVDLRAGQKTGFYLDQRLNRPRVAAYASGRRAADVCCYSGAFALVLAASGAAQVSAVDSSARALGLARSNAALNGMEGSVAFHRGDALGWLEARADGGATYDLIVLDPPRLARSRRGVAGALRAYRRLNAAAVRALAPGGILATFSCSGRVSAVDFERALGSVANEAGRHMRILERLGQPADHPVAATCPETAYLKGLICAVT